MNKTATICLTIIGLAAIAGAVICGWHGVTTVAATLGALATGCASGIVGYTIGSKETTYTIAPLEDDKVI